MTYLDLCKMVQRLIGAGDALPGTAPTTVTAQTGVLYEITQWINDAYTDIQVEQPNWFWMEGTGTVVTSNRVNTLSTIQGSIALYDQLIPFFDPNGTRYITCNPGLTSTPVSKIFYEDYATWRGYRDREPIPTGLPAYFTIRPDKAIELFPSPDQSYQLNLNYRRTLHTLVNDSDTPLMPDRYHNAIAWRAVWYWAQQRENPNKFQTAGANYEDTMMALRREQLPEWFFKQTLYYAP